MSLISRHVSNDMRKYEQQKERRAIHLEIKIASSSNQWQLVQNRLEKLDYPAVIEEVQERIQHKVDQLKRNIDAPICVQTVQGAIEGVLQQDKAEEAEIERRQK